MNNTITFIHWNISMGAKPELAINRLMKEINGPFLVSLMEVLPSKLETIKACFGENVDFAYSLDHRKPGKYDTMKRMLGVLYIAGNGVSLQNANVMNRSLLPDRTLISEFEFNDNVYKIASLHSITGCDHRKAKSVNFLSCAEEVEAFEPDIFTTDANEPRIDHYDIDKMEFHANGKDARTLFNVLTELGLSDSYATHYDISQHEEGKPLVISHIVKGGKKEYRYDFMFINENKFKVNSVDYILDETITECKADHAMIVVKATTK